MLRLRFFAATNDLSTPRIMSVTCRRARPWITTTTITSTPQPQPPPRVSCLGDAGRDGEGDGWQD